MEYISYLIKSFSSDKNELVPFSLHSEAADRDRPRPLEAAGRAKNRLFSLVEEAEWVVTGDADLKIPRWSVLLFRGNKPAEDLCLLVLVSPPVGVASDSRGLCWTLKIWKLICMICGNYLSNWWVQLSSKLRVIFGLSWTYSHLSHKCRVTLINFEKKKSALYTHFHPPRLLIS